MQRLKSQSVIVRFFLYYLALLVIPMSACLYFYYSTNEIIRTNAFNSHMSALEQSIGSIDRQFRNVEDITFSLQTNLAVNQFIQSTNPYDDQEQLANFTRVQSYLSPYVTVNDFLSKIYIYSEKSNSIISDSFVSIRLDRLYPKAIVVNGLSREDFIADFLNRDYKGQYEYGVEIKELKGTQRYVVYAQSMTNAITYNANVFIFIDERNVVQTLKGALLNNTEGSFCYFTTGTGESVGFGVPDEKNLYSRIQARIDQDRGYFVDVIGGREMFVMHAVSTQNGFQYVCAIPMDSVMSETSRTRNLLILLLGATLCVSLLAALLLAYRQSTPIRNLIRRVSRMLGAKDVTDSYEFINQQISDILKDNQSLQAEMAVRLPLQRSSIIHSLLIDEYRSADEIRKNLSLVGIRTDARLYCVLIILINEMSAEGSSDDLAACKFLIAKAIEEQGSGIVGISSIDFERMAVLIESDQNEPADLVVGIESLARTIADRIERETNIGISFSGSIARSIEGIPGAYREAKVALAYTERVNDLKVQWFRKSVDTTDTRFLYSIETEVGLIRSIADGNLRHCKEILTTLYKYNFVLNPIPKDSGVRLLNSLVLTLGRLKETMPESAGEISSQESDLFGILADAAKKEFDPRATFQRISTVMEHLCQSARKQGKKQANPLVQKIGAYLEEHFTDPQLSLSSVASRFGITDIYLSRLFKESMDENYSKYVETLRMKKAKDLLDGRMRISDVAERCGYSSVQTFRRVFRQYYGHPPSETDPTQD